MEKAIQIAIENGWLISKHRERLMQYEIEAGTYKEAEAHRKLKEDYIKASIVADPLFWQCLGKGLGWKSTPKESLLKVDDFGGTHYLQEWVEHWHRFIDHLASCGEIDKFFKDLTAGMSS